MTITALAMLKTARLKKSPTLAWDMALLDEEQETTA
jgi:hypothetical protein